MLSKKALSARLGRPSRGMARAIAFAMAAVVTTSVGGCGLLGGDDSSSSGGSGNLEKSKIKVAVMSTIDLAPLRLAQDGGYFKNEGLDVEAVEAATGQVSLTKLIGGEVDIAYASYTPFFIAMSKNTADIKLVADASSAGPKSTMLVTLPTSSVKSVSDLAGKKIGITAPNTVSDTLSKSVMKDHGVDASKVQWVPIPLPNVGTALKNGDIDAGFLTEPFITQTAKQAGTVPVVDTATGATQDFPTAGYGSLGKFVSENPKTVAAFQRAMQKATRDAADRSKIEPLLVKYAKIDQDTAALTTLLTFQSTLDPRRIQRVPDLLLQMGAIPTKIDVGPMIAAQATS
ncbi:ABC transporter substrate-binding protein [Amycolatopsis keratiniphila]|uniref:Sulfonate/nitrate/taurine transport system substrate-binding protein n=1 Tax=Amycolatopsis keratiniphila TaxID=129921 RepID=R4T512_9PSEU|nr:sulfonate/nitrate/taurine transport system substrate-binding protein [Amycolatopsis keratiniphila]